MVCRNDVDRAAVELAKADDATGGLLCGLCVGRHIDEYHVGAILLKVDGRGGDLQRGHEYLHGILLVVEGVDRRFTFTGLVFGPYAQDVESDEHHQQLRSRSQGKVEE